MNDKLLSEITRQHLENILIELRDMHASVLPDHYIGHGLVVKDYDSSPSPVIRLHTSEAIRMAIRAMLEA